MVRNTRVPYHRGRFVKLRGFSSALKPPSLIIPDVPDAAPDASPAPLTEEQALQPIVTDRPVAQPVRDCMDLTGMDEIEIDELFASYDVPKPSLI